MKPRSQAMRRMREQRKAEAARAGGKASLDAGMKVEFAAEAGHLNALAKAARDGKMVIGGPAEIPELNPDGSLKNPNQT